MQALFSTAKRLRCEAVKKTGDSDVSSESSGSEVTSVKQLQQILNGKKFKVDGRSYKLSLSNKKCRTDYF
jgi:hypothetical protein